MKLNALTHPKTLHLMALLDAPRPTVIGHLELLWAWTGEHAVQGNIGKWPDGAIARACDWMGAPGTFIEALVQAGLIDAHQEHRYVIHDWREHAPRWVKSKLSTLKLKFADDVGGDDAGDIAGDDDDDVGGDDDGDTKGREGKGREASGREVKGREAHADGVDPAAWEAWIDYRKQIRKPLKRVSMPAAQQALAAFGSDQVAVVRQSIANGWQGLFALKANGAAGHTPAAGRKHREFGK